MVGKLTTNGFLCLVDGQVELHECKMCWQLPPW